MSVPTSNQSLSVMRVALAGAAAAATFFALCWVGSFVPIGPASHQYLQLFTKADPASAIALVQGVGWSVAFGLLAGGMFAGFYNLFAGLVNARHADWRKRSGISPTQSMGPDGRLGGWFGPSGMSHTRFFDVRLPPHLGRPAALKTGLKAIVTAFYSSRRNAACQDSTAKSTRGLIGRGQVARNTNWFPT